MLIESGGDNLAATFSPELADLTIYVIDVAAGDKIPSKGGPGITRSDLLVINKIDLAPHVGASLAKMETDAKRMRGARPFVMTNLRQGDGLPTIVRFIETSGGLSQFSRRNSGHRLVSTSPEQYGARILDMADRLAQWSEMQGGLTCTYFSPAHKAVAQQLRDMDALGRAGSGDRRRRQCRRPLRQHGAFGADADCRLALRHGGECRTLRRPARHIDGARRRRTSHRARGDNCRFIST